MENLAQVYSSVALACAMIISFGAVGACIGISLMGGAAAMSLSGVLLPVGHIIAGSIWAIFHILVITLQAFIFMMLTLIYLGQAHEAH